MTRTTLATLAERVLAGVLRLVGLIGRGLWVRFLGLSLVGKAGALTMLALTTGWLLSQAGIDALAQELWRLGWLIGSVLVTWSVLRLIWTRYTHRSHYRM